MNQGAAQPIIAPVTLSYEADLCGNIEQALKGLQGYGTMALELIQNADDAHAGILSFDARNDGLVVRNDASFSTCGLTEPKCPWERTGGPDGQRWPCNFHAIAKMGGRSKIHAAEQIGRFGIGFVSVYQITDTPIIRSASTELALNPRTGEARQSSIAGIEGTEFELPWAFSASAVREALNASPTPADIAAKLVGEVASILGSGLLFLRHLRRVELRRNSLLVLSVDIERTEGETVLTFGPDGRRERWIILCRNAGDIIGQRRLMEKYPALEKLKRSPIVSVAIPVDATSRPGLLYAYLPTRHATAMPLHINGDFFPHASRQEIVLAGEGHERHWNEALLAAAAATIRDNFLVLRDALGAERLWELGEAAFKRKADQVFSGFWFNFAEAAKASKSIWTTSEERHAPANMQMPPEKMPDTELAALATIGIRLLHPSLRARRNVLLAVGAKDLALLHIATVLEARGKAGIDASNPHLRPLWSAIATMIEAAHKQWPGPETSIRKLKVSTFMMDMDGAPACPSALRRITGTAPPEHVRRYVPACPIVHPDILAYPSLTELVGTYGLDDLARDLAASIHDASSTEARIGTAPEDVRAFYALLTGFLRDNATEAGAILADTPILWSADGFVTPSRGRLPGGFRDPIGHFEFVDAALFPPGMEDFACDVLGVRLLGFRDYIDEHLEDILARQPMRDQYRALLREIVDHKNTLDDDGGLDLLARKRFLRTRAGTYARPAECYYWSAPLETLLGDDPARWVEEGWMPPSPAGPKLRDILESRLGMPTTVSARHIVARIEEIADQGRPDDAAEAITPIIRHIVERWARFSAEDREVLAELRHIAFLPAQLDGKRDADELYLPGDIYRAARAAGFSSQVPVVDLTPLRRADAAVNDFLDLLEMPAEPPTEAVVAHLRHCMANGVPANDLTYAILSERVDRSEGLTAVDRLIGTAFIHAPELNRYLTADSVFWETPLFGEYWHGASRSMRQREALFRRLGVEDRPGARHYAALMLEITRRPDPTDADGAIHSRCLGWLAEALDRGEEGIVEAVEALRGAPSLLNLDSEPLWPGEAIWIDSEQRIAPFGTALNERLVEPPDVERTAAARLFRQLDVSPVSEVVRLRLATQPDETLDPVATERLRERADLILWLAPTRDLRTQLRPILAKAQIRLTETLRIQAEIDRFKPPVRSPASSATAFYDPDDAVLHVKGPRVGGKEWRSALQALFAQVEQYGPSIDMRPLIGTALTVI